MARLHIFDMGGVVSRATDVVPAVAERLGIGVADFLRLASRDLAAVQAGALSVEAFWRTFSEASGIAVTEELWGRFFAPVVDSEVLALIGKLKARGRVVCGTNTLEPHYEVHRRLGDYACFDEVYASHRMGLVKPDPAFYRRILGAEEARPSEAFFVDDSPENVEAARRVGIDAELFTGAASLARRLGLEQAP